MSMIQRVLQFALCISYKSMIRRFFFSFLYFPAFSRQPKSGTSYCPMPCSESVTSAPLSLSYPIFIDLFVTARFVFNSFLLFLSGICRNTLLLAQSWSRRKHHKICYSELAFNTLKKKKIGSIYKFVDQLNWNNYVLLLYYYVLYAFGSDIGNLLS